MKVQVLGNICRADLVLENNLNQLFLWQNNLSDDLDVFFCLHRLKKLFRNLGSSSLSNGMYPPRSTHVKSRLPFLYFREDTGWKFMILKHIDSQTSSVAAEQVTKDLIVVHLIV